MKFPIPPVPVIVALCFWTGAQPLSRGADSSIQSQERFRIAVSTRTMEGVNDNDARAAMKIWADTFLRRTGMVGIYDPGILTSPEQLVQAARNGLVDALSITAPEYPSVALYVDHGLVIGDETDVSRGEEYILLVHEDSGVRLLADLRGRSLILHRGVRTCLANVWIDTLLSGAGLGTAEAFFGRITTDVKPAMVILPVFFRRSDAALVTRREFEAMSEMNPQLGRKLRILATSPKVLHTFLLFHKNCPPELKERLKVAMLAIHESTAGQQILTLWQGRRLVATDTSALRGALDLMAAYDRIKGVKTAAKR
jgi:ABC-type phosphate/phosphonate transport system substrate-binding protein